MIAYHGTTRRRAMRICQTGFSPKKPSRRVWFAESRKYAEGRAKTQARRAHDRPVVLTCEIDLNRLRGRVGRKRVFHRNRVVAIDASVPISVLRSNPAIDSPSTPKELAGWINRLLRLKPHRVAQPNHPGILRLSRWVANRRTSEPERNIQPRELAQMARRWLPEYFEGVRVDFERLRVYRRPHEIRLTVTEPISPARRLEAEALECLESDKPARRARGLKLLARIEDPDLFDWCAMYLEDESVQVVVAALRAMLHSRPDDPGIIEPLTESPHKQVRAAAIPALAKHGGRDATRWYERGLKDPEPCVRLETARVLKHLDPKRHRGIFQLARYDPNPEIEKLARKLTAHQGYADKCPRAPVARR